jgi:hypothetical protein
MKNLSLWLYQIAWLCQVTAAFFCSSAIFASEPAQVEQTVQVKQATQAETTQPFCEWSLLWSGSWEKTSSILLNRTFHNQGEIDLYLLPLDLRLRGQVLDRRTLNLELSDPWADPVREITNFTGGLYHTTTNSRLLYGVIDEWGLPARIRNPWIRSPPYPENHKPATADLKTEASTTKEDELYLYLSSPLLNLSDNLDLWCFGSAQMAIDSNALAFSGGLDFVFENKSNLLIEAFYTEKTLPPSRINTWFSYPPPLPERDFRLYAAALLYKSPLFSISSDFALSETFAWGTDIYANLGLTLALRPIFISFAADGAGERFVYRDGTSYREGFRSAAKIEWRGRRSRLFRIDSVLRAPAYGEDFNRSSTGFFYRAPTLTRGNNSVIRITRFSLSADRNAENPLKINDNFSGSLGVGINLQKLGMNSPLRINFAGSLKGLSESEGSPCPFPIPNNTWNWESVAVSGEVIWTYKNVQIRAKTGSTFFEEKDEKKDFLVSASIRFKQGRIGLRLESPDLPEKWLWSISWRMKIQGKS